MHNDFFMLDVGCGNADTAKGDVNIDFFKQGLNKQMGNQKIGEKVNPKQIKNFVVADACHLPFKDDAFCCVYSCHVLEHVNNPVLMLKECYRVSSRFVNIRFPHLQGSGAKRPFHVNYIDENWVNLTLSKLGLTGDCFVSKFDLPISNRLQLLIPLQFVNFITLYSPFRLLKWIERRLVSHGFINVPFELEIRAKKNHKKEPIVCTIQRNNNTLRRATVEV